MLCRKIRHTLLTKSPINNNVQHNSCLIPLRYFSKRCFIFESLLTTASKFEGRLKMSSFRLLLKDLSVRRLWCVWTRSFIVNTVVKRIKRERSVREVIQCFRQTILRPRRTFFLAVTAAFNAGGDGFKPPSCKENITDAELKALVSELEGVEELSRTTLFCERCGQRVIIEKKQPGVRYCACKDAPPPQNAFEGWVPYMEAEDVVIWRKEYKPGQGLYAYKVYGRYRDVRAQDFAAVQVDGAYRRVWDAAVAALSVVERSAQGVADQAVLHWEVLWPRLFANRDYVYIRRHKEFEVPPAPLPPHTEGLFDPPPPSKAPPPASKAPPPASKAPPPASKGPPPASKVPPPPPIPEERPSVHSNAKRKAMENEAIQRRQVDGAYQNKVFVIISRSCEHPAVPESKNAIRVFEYWSNMVVKTLDGPEKPGMEFVLTYYDEPAVGGMPTGVAAWATGRAAPVYLDKMRRAANEYRAWREVRSNKDLPDFVSFSQLPDLPCHLATVSEQDMESSKDGPELNGDEPKRDQSTQTETELLPGAPPKPRVEASEGKAPSTVDKKEEQRPDFDYSKVILNAEKSSAMKQNETPLEGDGDKPKEEDEETSKATNRSWWRYLYPFNYFV